MGCNLARKLIASHLLDGAMEPGAEIALAVDQCLLQDATGTLVMLELEAMQLDRVRVEIACQYVATASKEPLARSSNTTDPGWRA